MKTSLKRKKAGRGGREGGERREKIGWSAGKGTGCQAWRPECHMIGENQVLEVILWPPHGYSDTCVNMSLAYMHTHTHQQIMQSYKEKKIKGGGGSWAGKREGLGSRDWAPELLETKPLQPHWLEWAQPFSEPAMAGDKGASTFDLNQSVNYEGEEKKKT